MLADLFVYSRSLDAGDDTSQKVVPGLFTPRYVRSWTWDETVGNIAWQNSVARIVALYCTSYTLLTYLLKTH